jgi:hypothetical protein
MKYSSIEVFTKGKMGKFRKLHCRKPHLIKNEKVCYRCEAHSSDSDVKECDTNGSCVVVVEKHRRKFVLNKPIICGSKVLESSKLKMYSIYYNELLPHFKDRMRLLYTDTDSFIVEIKSADILADHRQLQELLDTSNYPKDHPLYNVTNKKVIGKLKDEYPTKTLTRFIGLRTKCYALKSAENGECSSDIKRAKGVQHSIVQTDISFGDYERVLKDGTNLLRTQRLFRSTRLQTHTIEQQKLALSSEIDDKRFTCEDGVSTLPWGHYAVIC